MSIEHFMYLSFTQMIVLEGFSSEMYLHGWLDTFFVVLRSSFRHHSLFESLSLIFFCSNYKIGQIFLKFGVVATDDFIMEVSMCELTHAKKSPKHV